MATNQATLGILAALGAPFFMAVGFIIWDKTWTIVGGSAFALNLFKCNLAALGFVAASFLLGWSTTRNDNDDHVIFTLKSVSFLVLSGFIGIIVGDLAWLEALRLLGATKVFLIDSLKPFSAALMAWLVLGETINPVAYSGIILTIIGILVVSFEKEKGTAVEKEVVSTSNLDESINIKDHDSSQDVSDARLTVEKAIDQTNSFEDIHESRQQHQEINMLSSSRGYVFAVINVLLDTYGSLLTKQHGGGMSTFAINLIRFGSSGLLMVIVTIFMTIASQNKKLTTSTSETQTPWYLLPKLTGKAWTKVCIGVVFVTFLCPSLSNYALFQMNLAFALTLGSITPFYALILEWPFYGKKPSLRALFGVCLTIGGVAILSIWRKA